MSGNKKNTVTEDTTDLAAQQGGYAMANVYDLLDGEFADEFAGLDFRMDKIKIPAGGMTAFEIPDEDTDGDTKMVRSIEGVILYNHPINAYYRDKYTGGNNPPDCGSFDGKMGVGDPGGLCADCPYNQFGSAEGDSKGKACKNRRMLYILREGELFPQQLSVPTGSLTEYTRYAKRQLSKGRKLSNVVTKISLRKDTSSTGIDYSQAVFAFVRVLDAAEKAAVAKMTEQAKAYAACLNMSQVTADNNPFVDETTGEVIEAM